MSYELNKMPTHWDSFVTLYNFAHFSTLEIKMRAEMIFNHPETTCLTLLVSYLNVDTHFLTSHLSSDRVDITKIEFIAIHDSKGVM